MSITNYHKLLKELSDQSANPPGKDPVLGHFYTAFSNLLQTNPELIKLVSQIHRKRANLTNKHLVSLLYRSYQYVKFQENDLSYKSNSSANKWTEELNNFIANKQFYQSFRNLLLTKDTTTTIYQRYCGAYAVISHVFGKSPVSVADLGCGGNYGLRGFELNKQFKMITDHTPLKNIANLLSKPIKLHRSLAIDKENPDNPRVKKWRIACSFYPKELDTLVNLVAFENEIKKAKKVQFLKADLLTFDWLPKREVDVVILSTILYQLPPSQQTKLIAKAKRMLKPKGVLIVQDFAKKHLSNPKRLDFNTSWFAQNFSYRTFLTSDQTNWNFWEVLQWDNGRCNEVKPGEDYVKFVNHSWFA